MLSTVSVSPDTVPVKTSGCPWLPLPVVGSTQVASPLVIVMATVSSAEMSASSTFCQVAPSSAAKAAAGSSESSMPSSSTIDRILLILFFMGYLLEAGSQGLCQPVYISIRMILYQKFSDLPAVFSKKIVKDHRIFWAVFMKSAKNGKSRKIKILSGFSRLFIVIIAFLFCNFSGQNAASLLTEKRELDMLVSSHQNGDRTA